MKKIAKSFLACMLVCLMVVSMLIPASAEATAVDIFGQGASLEVPNPYSNMNAGANQLASQFEVQNGKMVGFVLCHIANATQVEGSLKIYKWDTDYAKTTAAKPIIQKAFTAPAVSEPTSLQINFAGAYAEGKYLALIEAKSDLNIWTHAPLDGVTCYVDGAEYETGSFKLQYVVDPDASEKISDDDFEAEAVNTEKVYVSLFGAGAATDASINFQLFNYYSIATKFTNNRGKLVGLYLDDTRVTIEDGELILWLYKWDTDYETTINKAPCYYKVYTLEMTDDTNPDIDRYLEFDRAFAEGEYLAYFTTEASQISFWSHAPKAGVELYIDDEPYVDEDEEFMATLKIGYIADPAAELDERPVEYPTPEPTQEPTPTPDSTPTPKPTATKAPTAAPTQAPAADAEGGINPIVIIAIVAAVVVVAVVVVLILKKKKA